MKRASEELPPTPSLATGGGKRARVGNPPAAGVGGAAGAAGAAAEEDEHRAAVRYRDGAGRRRVVPYCSSYAAFAKRRWLGRALGEFYVREYAGLTPSYVAAAIGAGAITVNGRAVGGEYVLRDLDRIQRRLHYHEPPVPGGAIDVLAESDTLLVVSKPAGVPVHASGPYRRNTLTSLLVAEAGRPLPHTVHRLDRLTSGLLLLAKDRRTAAAMSAMLAARGVRKRYVAEVDGAFPSGPLGATGAAGALVEAAARAGSPSVFEASAGNTPRAGGGGTGAAATAVAAAAGAPAPTTATSVNGAPDIDAVDAAATAACPFLSSFAPTAAAAAALAAGESGTGDGDSLPALGAVVVVADAVGSCEGAAAGAPSPPPVAASAAWTTSGWLRVATSIASIDFRTCSAGVADPGSATAKHSVTLFRLLGTRQVVTADGQVVTRSLVEAAPQTGRTHQIRVHSAWLGFPVADDPLYCPAAREALDSLERSGNDAPSGSGFAGDDGARVIPATEEQDRDPTVDGEPGDSALLRSMCAYCQKGPRAEFNSMQRHCFGISLHSYSYQGDGWSFSAPLPPWALVYLK